MSKNEKRKAGEGKSDDLLTIDEAAALGRAARPGPQEGIEGRDTEPVLLLSYRAGSSWDLRELPVLPNDRTASGDDSVREALAEIIALCQSVRAGEAKPRKTVARIEERAVAALQAATARTP